MAREKEGWFTLKDGTELFEKSWEVLASPAYCITCHAIDQRGWGKSVRGPSQRGLTGPTNRVLADIDEYVAYVANQKIADPGSTPLFLMGHSMGGQQVLHYLLSTNQSLTKSRTSIAGAVVEAPYIELDPSSQPASLVVMIGRLAAMISPKSQLKQRLDSQYISRDTEVNRAWKEDPLCHDYGTLEGMGDMLDRAARLARLSKIPKTREIPKALGLQRQPPVPVFWAHGTADRITAFQPSKTLFDALDLSGDHHHRSIFKAYEDAYHKIHAEPDGVGIAFAEDVGNWILAVAAAASSSSQKTNTTARDERGDGEVVKARL